VTDVSTDAETLRAEVERLKAQNAKLERHINWRRRLRRSSSALLLVLGCGFAVLSLLAFWLRATLLDTNRYVSTVAPLAANPDIQNAVADKLDTAITSRVDFAGLARQVLPDRADVLAPAIERGAESVISDRIHEFTRSERFQTLWLQANQRGHARLVDLLTTGRSKRLTLNDDTLALDLSPAVDRVKAALNDRGLGRIAAAIPPTVDGRVTLVQSSAFSDARTFVKTLKAAAIVLPILAVLCLIGSVFAAHRRRRALMRVGIGLAVAMVLLIAALAVARSAYLDAINPQTLPRNAASTIFDTLVALLRHGVRITVGAALVLALITFIAGLPLKDFGRRGWAAFATSSRRRWVAQRERPLMIIVGVVGMLVLLIWSPLTGGVVLIDLILVAAGLGLIYGLSKPADPIADQLGADDEHHHGHDGAVVGGHP
jgi:hypothetical protein